MARQPIAAGATQLAGGPARTSLPHGREANAWGYHLA